MYILQEAKSYKILKFFANVFLFVSISIESVNLI